jgi:hypothetical protein
MRHLIACAAVLVTLDDGPVISHGSAVTLHQLEAPHRLDDEVRLTDETQWRTGRGYRVACAALPPYRVIRAEGFLATSPARALIDCAREWQVTDSVVAIDAALQARLVTRAQLVSALHFGRHRVGIGFAGRALNLSDGRAESPLESRGRLALLAAGLPRPELQVEIYDARGFAGRVDAWYQDAGVAIEFDGQVKYRQPDGDRTPGKVLWDEKRREDRRDAAPRLRGLLALSSSEPRRYRVVKIPEPGSATSVLPDASGS